MLLVAVDYKYVHMPGWKAISNLPYFSTLFYV